MRFLAANAALSLMFANPNAGAGAP